MAGAWETPKSAFDLVVGIPYSAACPLTMDYILSLVNLIKPGRTAVVSWKGLPVDVARNRLARDALQRGARHLFFVDSDVLVPPEAILQLVRWKLPIIAGVYWTKRGYVGVWRKDPDVPGMYNPVDKINPQSLVEVDAVAAGCMLIDTRVFKVVPEPWFKWAIEDPAVQAPGHLSEDIWFCNRAQEHGFRVFIDPTVKCEHEMLAGVDVGGKSQNIVYATELRRFPA